MTMRLPFDPDRARGDTSRGSGADDGGDNGKAPMSVTQVAALLNRVLEGNVARPVRIIGEISNLSDRNHMFFSLKDDGAVLRCVAFASRRRHFSFDAANGMQVIATGTIQYYAAQGSCQLYVDAMDPVGAGPLELRYRALCDELRRAGYFEASRKKTLPAFPRRIGVITSATGAALQDVLDTLKRRCSSIAVTVIDVRVQGPLAAPEIVNALDMFRRAPGEHAVDAVLLTRGGGSIEDLWAFNERIVADALLDFPIPTVAAIGHETDTTIAELVADQRCATPSQAAMRLSPDREDCEQQIRHLESRLSRGVTHRLELANQRVEAVEAKLGRPADLLAWARSRVTGLHRHLTHAVEDRLRQLQRRLMQANERVQSVKPVELIAGRERALAMTHLRLEQAMRSRLDASGRTLDLASTRLEVLDPRLVLERGYSITRSESGTVVRSREDVQAGEIIETQVASGRFASRVTDGEPATKRRTTSKRRTMRPSTDEADQMDLFGKNQ